MEEKDVQEDSGDDGGGQASEGERGQLPGGH